MGIRWKEKISSYFKLLSLKIILLILFNLLNFYENLHLCSRQCRYSFWTPVFSPVWYYDSDGNSCKRRLATLYRWWYYPWAFECICSSDSQTSWFSFHTAHFRTFYSGNQCNYSLASGKCYKSPRYFLSQLGDTWYCEFCNCGCNFYSFQYSCEHFSKEVVKKAETYWFLLFSFSFPLYFFHSFLWTKYFSLFK